VRAIAATVGIEILTFEVDDELVSKVTPYDASSLAVLMVEELERLHHAFPKARRPMEAQYPGRRFPSQVFQRSVFLELILQDILDAGRKSASASPVGG
jgi:hypothetical protein